MVDKINELLRKGMETGEPGLVNAMIYNAAKCAEEGKFCQCMKAKTVGGDLLCGNCYLIDRRQVTQTHLYRSGWHDAMPDKKFPNLCIVCVRAIDHPIHHREQKVF